MKKRVLLPVLALCACLALTSCVPNLFNPTAMQSPDDAQRLDMPEISGPPVPDRSEPVPVDVDEGNIARVLAGLTRPDKYIWSFTVTYSLDGASRTLECVQYVSGGNARLEARSGGETERLAICREGTIYVISPDMRKYYSYQSAGRADYDALLSAAGIADLVPVRDIGLHEPSLGTLDGRSVLLFTVVDELLGLSESYTVSCDSAVPLRVESSIGGEPYYTLVTTGFELVAPDEMYFVLPDGVEG